MKKLFLLVTLAVVLILLWACDAPLGISAESSIAGESTKTISDGGHSSGNEHFYFLPPLVPMPSYDGTFKGNLSPVVKIEPLGAVYTMDTGPGSETVRVCPEDEHYIVNWHTDEFDLDPSVDQSIQVWADDQLLGFADVDVVSSGSELKSVETEEYIPLKDGRTLPIKFRIEEGAVKYGWLDPWSATAPLKLARRYTCVVAYNNYLYSVGGYSGGSHLNSVEKSPINSDGDLAGWTYVAPMNTPRDTFGVVVYNGYIYAVGGGYANGVPPTKTVEYARLDPSSGDLLNPDTDTPGWKYTSELKERRGSHGLVAYNGFIYAIAGGTGSGNLSTVEFAKINPVDGSLDPWQSTSPVNVGRVTAGAVVCDWHIYLVGGADWDGDPKFSTVEYAQIDPSTGALGPWEILTSSPLNIARNAHGCAEWNGFIYAVGGHILPGGSGDVSVEYAQINSDHTLGTWSLTSPLTFARFGINSTVYNGYIYAAGGGRNAPARYYPLVEFAKIIN